MELVADHHRINKLSETVDKSWKAPPETLGPSVRTSADVAASIKDGFKIVAPLKPIRKTRR